MRVTVGRLILGRKGTRELQDVLKAGCVQFVVRRDGNDGMCRQPVEVLTYGAFDSYTWDGLCYEHAKENKVVK